MNLGFVPTLMDDRTRPAGIGTDVVNNSVSPIFLSWARSIVKHAGKYSHNLVFSPLFSREELEVIKRVGQKANLRPSFRGNVEGEDLQLVLGRDIWTIARELLKVGGHNDNYQLIPPRNMGTLPSPICHSTTFNQQVPNSTQDSMTSNQTSAELDLKTFKAKCKYWSHKVVHPSMIIPADSLEELVHQLAEQMGWKPLPSQEVEKSSRTSTGLSTFPRSFSEWGEVLIETYKHIESWEDLTFSPDFSSEDKTVLARIALESGLLCRRVKTSNFLLLVVSKQFFLSKVIKSLITFPELNNKYELLPPEIIPQLEMKDELDKAMNSPEDEHQTLCDPAKTKQMKDPLNCRVIESLSKTCDEKPVASSSNLVGVDKKHSLLRNKLRTNLSSKGTVSNRPSFLKDPQLAKVLPNGDYGQMVLLDSCDLGAVIEDVIRSLSESCIDFEFVHVRPKKRKEREFGLKLNTCKILIGGKTVTIGQHKKMRGAAVIAANKLMTKLKLQHFFVKGPRPRFLPVPFISDEKAFVIYAEKLLQEYSREETSSALVLKTDLRAKKEKILGRIAKRLDLKMFRSQPNIHSIVITKLTNFWTLVKLLASGDQNANYKLIAPPS
uniref:Uncharacterized protein n=1 Tax=Timema douglasi TaxID=61478 RepID=A0A7R8Z8R0_TIMDO|nr:unnamed protein product [Timema douglasi]